MSVGPLDHVAYVGECLDELDAPWVLGGSLASSLLGEPRSTNDVDIAVELAPDDVAAFVDALGGAYYASIAMLAEAATSFGRIDRDLLLRDAARCGLGDLVERALDESS